MKCVQCEKEIPDWKGKVISCDGDFVCDDKCHDDFKKESIMVGQMSDTQFEKWMGV
jgi:hypothetical protein